MNSTLLNRAVAVSATDLFPAPIEGIVVGIQGDTIAIRLFTSMILSNGEAATHVVASIRHEDRSLTDIANGQNLLCGITLVPESRFDPNKPCDLSWWRGGGAAIGDVTANPKSLG